MSPNAAVGVNPENGTHSERNRVYLRWGVKVVRMPKNQIRTFPNRPGQESRRPALRLLVACLFTMLPLTGCLGKIQTPFDAFRSGKGIIPKSLLASDNIVLAGGRSGTNPQAVAEFDNAKKLFAREDYSNARSAFYTLARKKDTPPDVAEACLFYEAECYRMEERYPKAAEIYSQMLKEYPRKTHHKYALERMFDIANYWLNDTRKVLEKTQEVGKPGKSQFVMPVSFVQWDKRKPMWDMEGRALKLLEQVYINDIGGELAEQSLFYLGSVNMLRGHYGDADHYFYQIVQYHPNGHRAPQAIQLAMMCKKLSTGGPEYDGRKLAEARDLIHRALQAYPQLRDNQGGFLRDELISINMQQADSDLQVANFYLRTGHPASALFYYEIVRRRYPNTKHAEIALKRMNQIRDRVDRERESAGQGNWYDSINIFRSAKKSADNPPPPSPSSLPAGPPSSSRFQLPNWLRRSENQKLEQAPMPRTLQPQQGNGYQYR